MEALPSAEKLLRLALWLVRGISSRAIEALFSRHPPAEALALDRGALAVAMGLRPAAARLLAEAPEDLVAWARAVVEEIRVRGGQVLWRNDPMAPDWGPLRDPPEVLFLRGSLGAAGGGRDGGRAVAVVGARQANPGALRLARRLGHALARRGHTVVSGGAFGVDAAAHRGALDAGGKTVAVLGSGVLLPQPRRNRRLFAEILEANGGLASELPPREAARKEFFPRRNRLVAALSRAVIVVQASETSGSLHTAHAALEMGRPVYVVAARDASNAGGRRLLAEGAFAVEDEEDVLEALEGGMRRPGEGRDEVQRLLDALDGPPQTVGELAFRLGMDPARVAGHVARLCRQGKVVFSGPGRIALRQLTGSAAPRAEEASAEGGR